MADDEAKVLAQAKALPMSERVAHKNWKVRSEAYDDISTACQRVFSDDDPVLGQYGTFFLHFCINFLRSNYSYLTLGVFAASLFGKAVGDGNVAALDKVLDALLCFLQKASETLAAK